MKEIEWSVYSKTLPLARNLVYTLVYSNGVRSHQEFAARQNKIGEVNRMLIEYEQNNNRRESKNHI